MAKTREVFRYHWFSIACHWSTAVCFYALMFFIPDDSDWHRWIGYLIVVIIFLRIVWGFTLSPRENRMFNYKVAQVRLYRTFQIFFKQRSYMLDRQSELGVLATWIFWTMIPVVSFTGWLSDTIWGLENNIGALHEVLSMVVFLFTVMHVSLLVVRSIKGRTNIIRGMLVGKVRLKLKK